MKLFTRHNVVLLAVVGALVSLAGCGGDDDEASPAAAAAYPRSVTVEYKVTSTTGLTQANVNYANETGGMSSVEDAPLPFSKKFTRTVKQFDSLSLAVTTTAGGAVTAEILVDDKSVASKDHSGTSSVYGSTVHVFP